MTKTIIIHFINNGSSSSYSLEDLDERCDYFNGSVNDIVSLLSLSFQYLKEIKLDFNQFNVSRLSSNDNYDSNAESNSTSTTIINSTSS